MANSASSACSDEFDAQDLMRHLQENEGYNVYEFFEVAKGRKGARVLAPRRLWMEAEHHDDESRVVLPGSGGEPVQPENSTTGAGAFRPSGAASRGLSPGCRGGGGGIAVDGDPWIVLTPSSPPGGALDGRPRRPPAKAGMPGPPPAPKAKAKAPGKAPMPKPKSCAVPVAKAAVMPPPFGKRLHWKQLPSGSLNATIFGDLRPEEVAPPVNKEQLEQLFAPAQRPSARERAPSGGSLHAGEMNSAGPIARARAGPPGTTGQQRKTAEMQVCLLDSKQAMNLAIVLRQVTIPTEELSEVLKWMRTEHKVTTDTLEHVCENLVPQLECCDLLNYRGPPEALRDVERQLLPLARLSRLKARLRILILSKKMPQLRSSLLSRIHALRSACEQVRSSEALRKVLGTVLRVGNFLNHGVDTTEVRGFAVESLLKLREFRAAQGGEVSALHCVVMHLMPVDPRLPVHLRQELRSVLESSDGQGAGIMDGGTSDLLDAVSTIQDDISLVQAEIEQFGACYLLDGEAAESSPLAVLQQLSEAALEIAQSIDEELRDALATALRLLEYFGERHGGSTTNVHSCETPPCTTSGWSKEACAAIEKFFAIIREFATSFEECWREVLDPRKLKLEGSSFITTLPTASAVAAAEAVAMVPCPRAAAGRDEQRRTPGAPPTPATCAPSAPAQAADKAGPGAPRGSIGPPAMQSMPTPARRLSATLAAEAASRRRAGDARVL